MALLHLFGEATFDTVRLLGMALRAICVSVSTDSTATQIEIAVVEACNNVVEHAYSVRKGAITLDVMLDQEKIVIAIHDTGDAMPTESQKDFTLDFDPTKLDSLPEGGMGLFLMSNIMDTQEYISEHGKNTLTLTKFLQG